MSKVLSWEDRQTRELEFVQQYVENGGNATEAAKAVGVSDNSASTVGHRLKNRLSDEIETEQIADCSFCQLGGYGLLSVPVASNLTAIMADGTFAKNNLS